MTYTRWTPENKNALESAAKDGQAALDALAARLGCGMITLRKAIVRFGFSRPVSTHRPWGDGRQRKHARWTPELEARIREAAAEHGGLARLAREVQVSPAVICRHAERLGAVPASGKRIRRAMDEHSRGVKTCAQCGETKSLEDFGTHSTRGTPNSRCRVCAGFRRYTSLADALRHTTAHRKGKIPVDELTRMFDAQAGRCYYTDARMDFMDRNTCPSVDRLNSGIGYVGGNMVLCCRRVNIIKNTSSVEDFIVFANLVANKHPRGLPGGAPQRD